MTVSPVRLVFGADIRRPTDLIFAENPVTSLPVRLVFGEDVGVGSKPDATVAFDAALPALTGAQAIILGLAVSVRSVLPGLLCSADVQYQSQTQRPTVASVHSGAQVAATRESGITAPEQHALRMEVGAQAAFTEAILIGIPVDMTFVEALRIVSSRSGLFEDGQWRGARLHANWQDDSSDRRPQHLGTFKDGFCTQNGVLRPRFQDGLRDRRNWLGARFQEASKCAASRYRGHAGAGIHGDHQIPHRVGHPAMGAGILVQHHAW